MMAGPAYRTIGTALGVAGIALIGVAAHAQVANEAVAQAAAQAFADHCFRPTMTAQRAGEVLAPTGARVDFYDLDPFSNVDPSPATGQAATDGTDRRCEVSFDGTHVETGIAGVMQGLEQEGIRTQADVPENFSVQDGTEFIAARALNPNRIAVVQVGTRPGPDGIETFINVERLLPRTE